jgi:hypothetical protein
MSKQLEDTRNGKRIIGYQEQWPLTTPFFLARANTWKKKTRNGVNTRS